MVGGVASGLGQGRLAYQFGFGAKVFRVIGSPRKISRSAGVVLFEQGDEFLVVILGAVQTSLQPGSGLFQLGMLNLQLSKTSRQVGFLLPQQADLFLERGIGTGG